MASTSQVPDLTQTPPALKLPLLPLLICCLLAVFLALGGCGGLVYFLARTGRLGAASAPSAAATKVEPPVTTHPVVIEPLLVNLADDDGHSFLRVSIVLGEAEEKKATEEKPAPGANASVRDTILEVLGRQHSADLLDPTGKERLKKELKVALAAHVPEAKVQAIYFTDFLVQR